MRIAKSEIITKEIAEESIKSIISEESDKSDFVISKNILISIRAATVMSLYRTV